MYRKAIARDIASVIQSRRIYKSMSLDLQQHASDELISLINTKFTSLKHEDKEARLRDHLRSAGVIKERMKASIHETLCAAAVELPCGLDDVGQFVDTTFENIDEILSGLRNEDYSHAERFERIEDEPVARDDARESNSGAAGGWFRKNGLFRWFTAGGNQ
ncbi:hypothetical protein [Cupriavidus sp. DL-D2]|jgi:hypothetical protein|uniref:hypothetical protein n=1 Tax=Cupriavidus sp. DL-D2 TaxID=3144974 RepID=UPI0032136B70